MKWLIIALSLTACAHDSWAQFGMGVISQGSRPSLVTAAASTSPIANMNGMVDNLANNTTIPTNYWTSGIVTTAHYTNAIGAHEVFDSAGATSVKNWVPGMIFTNNTCILTNPTVTFVAGNPWTYSISFRAPPSQVGAQSCWVSTSTGIYLKDGNKPNLVFSGTDHEASISLTNFTVDTVLTLTCDGSNPVLVYVNGTNTSLTIARPTVNMVLQAVGNNGSSNLFVGGLMNFVWATNYQAGATEVSNIAYFQCTNNCPAPTDYVFNVPFNEGSGTTIHQLAGTPYTTTITGSNSWATDNYGNPYLTLTNGGYVAMGASSTNTLNSGPITVVGLVTYHAYAAGGGGDNGKNPFVDKISGDQTGTGWEVEVEGASGTQQRCATQNNNGGTFWEPQSVSSWAAGLPSGLSLCAVNQTRVVSMSWDGVNFNGYYFNDGVQLFANGDQATLTGSIANATQITIAVAGSLSGATACSVASVRGFNRNLTPLELRGIWAADCWRQIL